MANITYGPIIIDVLLSDVQSTDLHEKISEMLDIKYLSNSMKELDDVKGILSTTFRCDDTRNKRTDQKYSFFS